MRKTLLILLFSLSANANAASSAQELCETPKGMNFEGFLSSVNQFLSSSNPLPRHSDVRSRVNDLPALETYEEQSPSQPIVNREIIFSDEKDAYVPIKKRSLQRYDDALIEEVTVKPSQLLSPKTESMFGVIPQGIGEEKTVPQEIFVDSSKFEIPSNLLEKSIDALEEIVNEQDIELGNEPKFEITVSEAKPKTGKIALLENALKALTVGQYESAVAIYKQVLKKYPKERDALFGVATAYHRAGERKKARNAYGELLKYYPKFEEGINNFISLASAEAPEHALQELIELQKNNPKFPAIFAQKGLIYAKLGDKKQAIKNLAYALKLDPSDNNYKYNLAILLDEVGKAEYAAQLYQELIAASYKGEEVPVGRKHLEERIAHIIASSEF